MLNAVAGEWAAGPAAAQEGADAIAPQVNGVVDSVDTGVVLQVSVRVRAGRQWAVEADLRQRMVAALAAAGIPIDSRVTVNVVGREETT